MVSFGGDSMKRNRAISLVLVTLAYLAAIAVGAAVYLLLSLSLWLTLLIADCAATAVVFIFSLAYKNSSTYDPYWSVQPIVIAVGLALDYGLTVAALLPLIAVSVWGARLTANWAYTFKNLTWQDWRYTMLRQKTGRLYPIINFLGIHLFPTLVVYLCCLPLAYTFTQVKAINAGSVIFFALSVAATVLQGAADCQMHAFRKKGSGGFIKSGLWKYSRHPNYLGEILFWWGIGLAFVCACPTMWYLLTGALVNTLMFLLVSVPMADKRQSQKPGFDEYKKGTRMLLPIKK